MEEVMGAPGYTIFCKNGHIVKIVPHHCLDGYEVHQCHVCGADEFATVWEWPDPDYEPFVPENPIAITRKEGVILWQDGSVEKTEKVTETFDVSGVVDWWKGPVA